MRLPITSVTFMFLICTCALGQVICGRAAGSPIDMKVKLSIEEPIALNADAGAVGLSTAASNPTGGAGTSGKTAQEFSAMQIRVELQNDNGDRLQESSPNAEGVIVFTVCNRAAYRLRITGSDIEETTTQDLQPGRGDRLVNVDLHRKGDKNKQHSNGAISASRLSVPKKAFKTLQQGNVALVGGRLSEAKALYEKAIAEYPQFDQAYNNLGVVLMESGDKAAGKAAFEKAVAINDHFGRALSNLAKISFDEKNYSKSLDQARRSLAIEPLHPQTLLLATKAAYFSNDYSDCVGYARSLHVLSHTGMGIAHYFSAKCLEKQNMPTQAIAEYQLFMNEDPNDPNVPRAQMAIVELKASSQSAVN